MGVRWMRRMAALATILGLLALLLLDLRHRALDPAPRVLRTQQGSGQLLVGTGASPIAVPYPVVPAGYGFKDRHAVTSAAQPQRAQALSLAVGDARLTLVSVDLLELDSKLPLELRPRLPRDAGEVWLCATHTHSGMGNYDPNLVAQLAGTGRFREDARRALGDAIVHAVEAAVAKRLPSAMTVAQVAATFAGNRDDPAERVTEPLSVVTFPEASAQLLAVPAHPTLVGRPASQLDADFPGHADPELRTTLALQAASGDLALDRSGSADRIAQVAFAARTQARQASIGSLRTASVELTLPPVEVHAAPEILRTAASNLVDRLAAPRSAELSVARLGELTLIAVPGEPTQRAGGALRVAANAPDAIVLGLCNGYVGYIETSARVVLGSGETRRQEFDASLLDRFASAARLAEAAVGNASAPASNASAAH